MTNESIIDQATDDMRKGEEALGKIREQVREELTFSSITMELPPIEPDHVAPVVEHIIQDTEAYNAYAALLADAQDRVMTYGTLEMLSVLRDMQSTMREIVILLKDKLQ